MNFPLRVLHLEDDARDTELVQAALEGEGIQSELTRVEREEDFLAALKRESLDLILADYTLPSFDGLSALRIAQQHLPDVPFIFVSGTLGEDVAIEALKTGATDYVLKTRLARLGPSVNRALREARERANRKRAEEAVRQSEKQLRDLIETIPAMAFVTRPDGSSEFVSRPWIEYSGLSEEQTAGSGWAVTLHPDDLKQHLAKWRVSRATGQPFENEARHRDAHGNYRWLLARAVPLRDEQEKILKWYGALTDIEDRKRAEALLAGEKRILVIRCLRFSMRSASWSKHSCLMSSLPFCSWREIACGMAERPACPIVITKQLMVSSLGRRKVHVGRLPIAPNRLLFPTSLPIRCGRNIAIWLSHIRCVLVGPRRFSRPRKKCWGLSPCTIVSREVLLPKISAWLSWRRTWCG